MRALHGFHCKLRVLAMRSSIREKPGIWERDPASGHLFAERIVIRHDEFRKFELTFLNWLPKFTGTGYPLAIFGFPCEWH